MAADSAVFSGKRAYEHLRRLAVDIGPRLTGSEGEHKAARYISGVFRSFGLKTRFQRYPATTYDNRKCLLEILENGKWRSIRVSPVMLSQSTPKGGLEGEIHFIPTGEPQHFSPAFRDKIVLTLGGVGADDRRRFLSFRPKALIMIEEAVKALPRCSLLDDRGRKTYGNLPMGLIGHLDGLRIVKQRLRRARFTMINAERRSYSLNVIGQKTGSDSPDEIAVICGHYDSHMGISGATDNAAGTAIVMELARVLSALPSRRTLRFIAFAGEETGLHGSVHYADALARRARAQKKSKSFDERIHKTPCDRHRLTFNIDVHGAVLGRNIVLYSGVEDIGSSVRLLAKETGLSCRVEKKPMSSDGTPLAAVGIPAVQLGRYGGTTSFGHTAMDVIRYLSADALEEAGAFALRYLRRYVTDIRSLPFPREIPEDQMKAIKEYFQHAKRPLPGEARPSKR